MPWKPFIDKLNSEWEAFTLYSSVILNVNIAFLVVPSLSSAARISNYASTVSSAVCRGRCMLIHADQASFFMMWAALDTRTVLWLHSMTRKTEEGFGTGRDIIASLAKFFVRGSRQRKAN
ncbi:hypothetical protein K503DRAFT_120713 [Rhizopogon vinicolor AM-OR11-026]|uniref:Uncharacterized protein n=1 Tax=Rhizopogon vinicolor AM-OR11-026 TaxID=1314800 RepID=A0A1B7N2B1_9AGAM|nr:hypothetical protein K503DRAFT_120713 [Rhizopogon vinicolor AM-OR11-026]